MTNNQAVNWLINVRADIGKAEHRELWHYEQALAEIIELLEEEPERRTGQWIIDNEGMIHCSECTKIPVNRIQDSFKVLYDIHPLKMNYCPNCGARMEGENDG